MSMFMSRHHNRASQDNYSTLLWQVYWRNYFWSVSRIIYWTTDCLKGLSKLTLSAQTTEKTKVHNAEVYNGFQAITLNISSTINQWLCRLNKYF